MLTVIFIGCLAAIMFAPSPRKPTAGDGVCLPDGD